MMRTGGGVDDEVGWYGWMMRIGGVLEQHV